VLRRVGEGSTNPAKSWLARHPRAYHAVKVVLRDRIPTPAPSIANFTASKNAPHSRQHPGWANSSSGRTTGWLFLYIRNWATNEQRCQKIESDRYRRQTLAGKLRRGGNLPLTNF